MESSTKRGVMYLPDTNIFILGLKGKEPEASFLLRVISENDLAISVIVVGEFLAKAEGEGREGFLKLMDRLGTLSLDEQMAQVAAVYRKDSLKTKRVQMLDCFLAAQAKVHKLVLVTNNKSDFPMKDIKIITP